MKVLWTLLAVMFLGSQALTTWSQQLPPVGNSISWGPIIFVGVIALAIAGLVFWHKRNPSKADAVIHGALTTAKDDASELARSVGEAIKTLVRTNAQQAVVIASPPVQAAINAGTAPQPVQTPQPTPQNAPQATISPAPVPSAIPAPAVAPTAATAATPNPTTGAPTMPATDVHINPADYPAIDPATRRLVDPTLLTTDPQAANLALNIWARQYGIGLMTDYQLRQAALYDSQRNNLLARTLIKGDPNMSSNPAVIRMMKSPEQVYYALLKKKASGWTG